MACALAVSLSGQLALPLALPLAWGGRVMPWAGGRAWLGLLGLGVELGLSLLATPEPLCCVCFPYPVGGWCPWAVWVPGGAACLGWAWR